MMMRSEQRLLKFVVVLGMLGAPACGDSDSDDDKDSGSERDADRDEEDASDDGDGDDAGAAPKDAGADKDAGKGDASTMDASASDGGSSDSGASDSGASDSGGSDAGPVASCSEYCSRIMTNCVDANKQYASMAVCMAVCGSFPAGAASDTAGNTLGCRFYHAGAAAGAGATTHCNHAGLTGGDKNPMDSDPGTCGEGCDAFCNEAVLACTNANTPGGTAPYANKAACMTECKMFPSSSNTFSTADTSGNTFNCRAYHLTAASMTPDPHCGHIKLTSSTCK